MTKTVTNITIVLNALQQSKKKLCVATLANKTSLTKSQVSSALVTLMKKGGVKISRKKIKTKNSTYPVYCYCVG